MPCAQGVGYSATWKRKEKARQRKEMRGESLKGKGVIFITATKIPGANLKRQGISAAAQEDSSSCGGRKAWSRRQVLTPSQKAADGTRDCLLFHVSQR